MGRVPKPGGGCARIPPTWGPPPGPRVAAYRDTQVASSSHWLVLTSTSQKMMCVGLSDEQWSQVGANDAR
jgi:hypothetical protein